MLYGSETIPSSFPPSTLYSGYDLDIVSSASCRHTRPIPAALPATIRIVLDSLIRRERRLTTHIAHGRSLLPPAPYLYVSLEPLHRTRRLPSLIYVFPLGRYSHNLHLTLISVRTL